MRIVKVIIRISTAEGWFHLKSSYTSQEESDEGIDVLSPDVIVPPTKKFQPIILTVDDVPDALLPRKVVSDNTIKMLERWLKCRGLPLKAKDKAELVERVGLKIAGGKSHILDLKLDKGKWYEKKRAALEEAARTEVNSSQSITPSQQIVEFPRRGWKPFPSVEIPCMFNYGNIYFYLVESMPCLDNKDEEDDSGCEEGGRTEEADPFEKENFYINEIQIMRKGLALPQEQECWTPGGHKR